MNDIIKVENYIKKFKKNAIGKFSFEIQAGKVTALLGSSGSGKSVLINSVIGCYKKYNGNIIINDESIKKGKGFQQNKNIGFYSQIDFSLQNFSLQKYLMTMSLVMGIKRKVIKSRIQYWVDFFDLTDSQNKRVKDFSWGMKNRVNLILCLLKEPQILILDEPGANLDSYWRNKIKNLLIAYKEEGRTIIITAHNIDEISDIIDDYLIIDNGELVFKGSTDELNIYSKYKVYLTELFDVKSFRDFLLEKKIKTFKYDEIENSLVVAIERYQQINFLFLYLLKSNLPLKNIVKLPINMESINKALENKLPKQT